MRRLKTPLWKSCYDLTDWGCGYRRCKPSKEHQPFSKLPTLYTKIQALEEDLFAEGNEQLEVVRTANKKAR
jgi:hypothetical protein